MIVEPVEGDGVRLRAHRDTDVDDLVSACSDPLTRRYLPLLPSPYTRADAEWWITHGVQQAVTQGGTSLVVADRDSDRLVGSIGLERVVALRRQAEIGYWTAPWARGRGVARAAVRALSDHALAGGLDRLELLTDWSNVASQRVALAAGYTREGVRRGGSVHPGGGRYDVIAFARLAGDPPGPVERLLPDLPGGELTDGTVTVRPLAAGDADFYHRLMGVPDVAATAVPPGPPGLAEAALRCARSAGRWLAGERAGMVIEDAAGGGPAGTITLGYDDPAFGQATIGYNVLPAWRGRGYAGRAVGLVALWAFAETGVARLVASTLPDNAASQRVLSKAGFQREARLRARLPGAAGRRNDGVQFALLATDLLRATPPLAD